VSTAEATAPEAARWLSDPYKSIQTQTHASQLWADEFARGELWTEEKTN